MNISLSPSSLSNSNGRFHRFLLAFLLVGSIGLRILIAVRGGQFFWTDEARYVTSRFAVASFAKGQIRVAFDMLFSSADHLLFKIVGTVPALIERAFGETPWIPAVFFGCFSVGLIYLVWRLVLEVGGATREALCSAFLVAACNTFFYYARHVFPYDLALCFFLSSAIFGLRAGRRNCLVAGLLAGIGFLCYNGYWLFGGVVLILCVFADRKVSLSMLSNAVLGLTGLILPIASIVIVGRLLGHDLVKSYIDFSRTVNGDFGLAWRFIPEYLWASEHYLILFLGFSVIAALTTWRSGRLETRVGVWLVGGLLFYIGMVAFSDVFRHFTIYARHVRPIVIFLCLIGGWFLSRIIDSGFAGRLAFGLVLPGILFESAQNMSVPIKQVFPPEFKIRAENVIRKDMAHEAGLYRVATDGFFESPTMLAVESHPFKVLYRRPHPLQFAPYTFDGYNGDLRVAFRTRDISMRVLRLLPENPRGRIQITRNNTLWAPFLGPVCVEIMFDPAETGFPQPIVTSGKPGAGDDIFVQFINKSAIRLGLDDWGAGAIFSQIIPCDYSKPHLLVISFGSLYPGDESEPFLEHPQWRALRHVVLVKCDGTTVLVRRMDCNPSLPRSIVLFHNFIGLSSAITDFQGRVLSASAVAPADLMLDLSQIRQ